MSYDLLVFNKESAPHGQDDFVHWYEVQTQWTEGHDYQDPGHTTAALRNWFMDMIDVFPPLNGPYATDEVDDPKATDYSVGANVIYAAFSWSEAEIAYTTAKSLADKHNVGFFDCQRR